MYFIGIVIYDPVRHKYYNFFIICLPVITRYISENAYLNAIARYCTSVMRYLNSIGAMSTQYRFKNTLN